MALDSNIILQGQPIQLMSPMEAMTKAMTMRQLARQNAQGDRAEAEDLAYNDAFKKNTTVGADGSPSLDKKAVLSDLYKTSPAKAMEVEKTFKQQDLEDRDRQLSVLTKQTEMAKNLAWSISDEPSYRQARATALKYGLPNADKMPEQFDPGLVKQMQMATLNAKEQLDNHWKQVNYDLERQKVSQKKTSGDELPLDRKKMVEGLATKNANKIAIKNQIDSVMKNWDSLSEDQQVAAGRQLLKTLNSTEGADAIGSEEAKRLGSKLEFAMGNLFNSNPVQFGRDLKGFKEQANNVSSAINNAVESNQTEIDRAMGRKSKPLLDTRTWEGVTYKRVGDEWVPQ